ncbi:TPA: ATP-binding protein [Enterobacter hormaechei subsp. xiangfangensis]|uniref:AAA family ATPase n=3 Tax=Enterobacter hormaechei TaxID=158836 RepID=UPI000E1D2873|nr:AAA family ATPase [Enterobacter hormaechei]HAV1768938.1 ATP-binding protein [Enterobacter hormaechei subsp. xiangfangensis]MDG4708804.1 AAA family ATPase [Enterobacter hormaechei]RDT06804.1 ATP-binding protein [Enterobacter hormaechei]RDT27450.1 ATP-binding protein [Enterobacter hormaechei]HDW3288451.1 ATP-binding protein [Enterobacter hormaechei subsp. xiangfangensis]
MIAGLFIRNVKTYQGINYIPLTDSPNLSGLLGNNGIGKSSILEAIDTILNSKDWNFNTVVKKSGLEKTSPYIVPVLILEEVFFDSDMLPLAKTLDVLAREISLDDATNAQTRIILENFIQHRDRILSRHDMQGKLIVPIGRYYNNEISLSVLAGRTLTLVIERNTFNAGFNLSEGMEPTQVFSKLFDYIIDKLEYLYIPKEIDTELFTKLESIGTQVLMGESLHEILDRIVGDSTVGDINRELSSFLEDISTKLVSYAYRTPSERQKRIQKKEVYNLIIQAFFNVRKLHKAHGEEHFLEISNLSSGEKQKAIIDVAHALLTKHRSNSDNLIIAIDEPESSLHMSACFEQFQALSELSEGCRQLLFSSHWYGFLPTLEKGAVTIITKKNNEHLFDLINLESYREEIKQLVRDSRGKLPFDIRIKSMNDFTQSLLSSATGENPYNWLICEGSSEKIYLSAYFDDLIKNNNLRIVPVGGASEIKKIYNYLSACYKDVEGEITGNIYLLADTDSQLVRYEVGVYQKLHCKRFVHDQGRNKAILVKIDSNPVSPATEIEDVLNAKIYYEALLSFVPDYSYLNFITGMAVPDEGLESFSALDLKSSEKSAITTFFDTNNNKFDFAKKYVELMSEENSIPDWINEIRVVMTS